MIRDRQYFIDTRAAISTAVTGCVPKTDAERAVFSANIMICLVEAGIPLIEDERRNVRSLIRLFRHVTSTPPQGELDRDLEVVIAVLESGLAEGGVH